MSVAEQEDLLRRMPNAILATVRRDGSPQVSPIWYVWDGRTFMMAAAGRTAKVHNMRRDPRVALCIDDPALGQCVTVLGSVHLHEGDLAREPTLAVIRKYKAEAEVIPHWNTITEPGPYVAIELIPERFIWPDW